MKIIGVVPARMASSRFPGKPLYPIHGRPMLEHVFLRAKKFPRWSSLELATCDPEIEAFARSKGWPVVMTSPSHARCLDRVLEAVLNRRPSPGDQDVVVCVQGDEPMLHPAMIEASIRPLEEDPASACTVLAMHIIDRGQFENPDTVKIVYNDNNDVLYTSRSPVPYCNGNFSPSAGARRIYGIFAFRWPYLVQFGKMKETRLERLESCDSNRILDAGFRQKIAPYPFQPSFSVESPGDIARVEESIKSDSLWGSY